MDILDLIKKERQQVETLFSNLENGGEIQQIYQYFNQLYEEINLQAEAKRQVFYPAISGYQDTEVLVDKAKNQQDAVKQMLEEIESFSPSSVEFNQKIRQLKQIIQQHVQEEEHEVFPLVRDCMNEAEREQLGKGFAAVKTKLQTEMF